MPETRVVHINDGHPDAIYIGRAVPRRGLKASPWANPFTIKDAGSRSLAIADYRGWVLGARRLRRSGFASMLQSSGGRFWLAGASQPSATATS